MPCREWNPEWVAQLYGELEGPEAERASDHLAACASCRQTLAELDFTRRWIRDEALGDVPATTPRVVVLPAGRLRHPAWAFASGLAAALLVFASGLYVGMRASTGGAAPARDREPLASVRTGAELPAGAESRLAALETAYADLSSGTRPQSSLTPEDLAAGLAALERRIEVGRARDVEFLLGEISATEWRAGKWIDETRQAMRYVAARNDPRLIER